MTLVMFGIMSNTSRFSTEICLVDMHKKQQTMTMFVIFMIFHLLSFKLGFLLATVIISEDQSFYSGFMTFAYSEK